MKNLPSIIASIFIFLGFGVLVAHAQNYVPLAPLPYTSIDTTSSTINLSSYLSGMLKLLIAAGGALSILMAIIGGTQYVAAGISPDAKNSAKEHITNAFIGLALILSSYLILNTIDPKLVDFNFKLPVVKAPTWKPPELTSGGGVTPAFCDAITKFDLNLTTPEARDMEAGQTVIFTSSTPSVQTNLNKLKAEVDKLQLALSQNNPPATLEVTSAYRPYEYQKHLYQIYNAWKREQLILNTDAACAPIKEAIRREYSYHHLQSLVANPDGQNAPHMDGTGVDLSISGISYAQANALAQSKGIKLEWQNIEGDINHFNLK